MQWDPVAEHVLGPVLYQSEVYSGPTTFMQRYDFTTGSVKVVSGGSYILFLSVLNGETATASRQFGVLMGYGYEDYPGGKWYASPASGDVTALPSSSWVHDSASVCQTCDAAFVATFSQNPVFVTPEPSCAALLGIGALGVGVAERRRAWRRVLSRR